MRHILVTNAKGGCGKSTIAAVRAFESGLTHVPRKTEFLVIDSPSGSWGKHLTEFVLRAETIIVPVLPSPIDINAAERYVGELIENSKVADKKAKAALVANRVK